MYIMPNMIDLGQPKEGWKSEPHRTVAQICAIQNPQVTNKDTLTQVCQAINNIPKNRIKYVTFIELRDEYNCPDIFNFD